MTLVTMVQHAVFVIHLELKTKYFLKSKLFATTFLCQKAAKKFESMYSLITIYQYFFDKIADRGVNVCAM